MTKVLLVAGSNSGYQLGVGHDEDVRTLQEALCRIDADWQNVTTFPPNGYKIVDLSSGANHTLALLGPVANEHDGPRRRAPREIWIAGTGAEGQLGPGRADGMLPRPAQVFRRFDLEACLRDCNNLSHSSSSEATFEPKRVVCGWNCSYAVLSHTDRGTPAKPNQDVLISLGRYRHNTFGELGSATASSSDAADRLVHQVSFADALAQAGLDADVPFEIVDTAAGVRHAVVALGIKDGAGARKRVLVVGWGSARQGQVGTVPQSSSQQPPGKSKRPGPAAAIVPTPQLIFNQDVKDPALAECKVRAGRHHTVVLWRALAGGNDTILNCIGSKQHQQLFDLSELPSHAWTPNEIADVACNWNSTHVLGKRKDGDLIFSCGNNARGQLGDGSRTSTSASTAIVSVDLSGISSAHDSSTLELNKLVSGSEHSLLLLNRPSQSKSEHRQVWGWGWNEHGNLAQGPHDEADRSRPVLLLDGTRSGAATLSNFYTPLDVWAGCGTSFILAEQNAPAG